MNAHLPLTGLGVLVTRPAGQAEGLQARICELGGNPILFPTLEIQPLGVAAGFVEHLDDYDLALFVSPSAVQYGLVQLASWPDGLPAAGIGQGTAAALRSAGIQTVLAPEVGADSEHLLALDELHDLAGRRVCIFRGEGGRELLADSLRARGAQVDDLTCYRRILGRADPAPVCESWRRGDIQAVTVLSAQTLDHLFTLLGEANAELIRATPLFAPHSRITDHARGLGVGKRITTDSGVSGLVRGLVEYFAHA